jgi:hypothetical protein
MVRFPGPDHVKCGITPPFDPPNAPASISPALSVASTLA